MATISPLKKPSENHVRNTGTPLHLDLLEEVRVNLSAVERRASSLGGRRSVKKDHQAAWLLKAITCIDLTTLNGDDTAGRVKRLCAKARQPVRADILEALGLENRNITTGAVCVYHSMIETAVDALQGSGIPVAAVSTGFPAGLSPFDLRVKEIEASVIAGAQEIDIVITRGHVLMGNWQALYDEVKAFRAVCGDAHLKAILGTGDLVTLRNVAKASLVAMMAGFVMGRSAVAGSQPNILFLFSDDHALKSISAYGGPLAKIAPTPNIDRLAKEGAIFENSFVANSICGPSRASILSGKHSHKNGFMNIEQVQLDNDRSDMTTVNYGQRYKISRDFENLKTMAHCWQGLSQFVNCKQ